MTYEMGHYFAQMTQLTLLAAPTFQSDTKRTEHSLNVHRVVLMKLQRSNFFTQIITKGLTNRNISRTIKP